ncbi:putative Ubiquitinyl hydrolase 1 [Rhodotorula taiwanensis]|uniref:Ubiquitin carboxyl-terminal hydrolase n=1 Tax=Rhodotorula taiwanensis TaxID=741276 RepID=A0A2S5BBA3_9BASI|nr:putative Ubiquitinyl hydrolase 1 [Rhodotorula taiwanensis]
MATNDPRWLPLESNPDSFNRWSASLGLDTSAPNGYRFADIWGLDPELLQFVKQPVKAVLMLFPVTPEYEKMRKEQDAKVEEDGVEGVEDVIYFKQTIRVDAYFLETVANACGTFALLHTLANTDVPLKEGPLTELFSQCHDKTPLERAQLLTTANELERVHEETAQGGQTAAPALEDETDLHFVTFVDHNGYLIELDGRRNSPINHGKIEDDLLNDTVKVVKRIMELTQSIQFNLVALSPATDDE